jgi:hypothetical protein
MTPEWQSAYGKPRFIWLALLEISKSAWRWKIASMFRYPTKSWEAIKTVGELLGQMPRWFQTAGSFSIRTTSQRQTPIAKLMPTVQVLGASCLRAVCPAFPL